MSCLDPIFVGSSRLHLPPVLLLLLLLGVAFLIGQNRHLDSSYSLSYLVVVVVVTRLGRVEQPLRINYALESAPSCLLVDRDCQLKLINDSRLDIPTWRLSRFTRELRRIVELGVVDVVRTNRTSDFLGVSWILIFSVL